MSTLKDLQPLYESVMDQMGIIALQSASEDRVEAARVFHEMYKTRMGINPAPKDGYDGE